MGTQFPDTLTPDDALVIDARYRFNNTDRTSIDGQIRGIQQVIEGIKNGTIVISGIVPAPGAEGYVLTVVSGVAAWAASRGAAAWQTGTDAAYTVTGTSGEQIVIIPALTASRTWKLPASPTDGMSVTLFDRVGAYVTASGSGWAITVQGNAGTEHVFAEGADKGTSYAVPVALLGDSSVRFVYHAATTSWEMA